MIAIVLRFYLFVICKENEYSAILQTNIMQCTFKEQLAIKQKPEHQADAEAES